MDGFHMYFENGEEFAKTMRGAPQIVQEEMISAVDRLTLQGVAWAGQKMEDNGSVNSGATRRSITAHPAAFAGGQVVGSFGTSALAAVALEKGRRGFGPKTKRALAFMPRYAGPVQGRRMNIRKRAIVNADGTFAVNQNRGAGRYTGLVVVKRVGPAEPRPFMQPTAIRLNPEVPKEFRAAMKRMIVRLTK